jgi:hypothetical protein
MVLEYGAAAVTLVICRRQAIVARHVEIKKPFAGL